MKLIRNVLVVMAGVSPTLMLSACSGEGPAIEETEETGTIEAALSGVSPSGIEYRLRYGQFTVSGPAFTSFSSEDYLFQPEVFLTLPAGQYSVDLSGSWGVERNENGTWIPVQAALVSQNPVYTQVIANQTTGVVFAFNVNGEVIEFGYGNLQLIVTFDDTPAEDTQTRCADGIDNDNDGSWDCSDQDCINLGYCGMGTAENHPAACQDGADNDFDGFIDCQDWDCTSNGFCGAIESDPFRCSDGVDNDFDGFADCQDPDCVNGGFCFASESTAATCSDGIDNDSDTFTDCTDFDCQNAGFCSTNTPLPGDLMITEVMYNPAAVPDLDGEWFEIYNRAPYAVDFGACVVLTPNNGQSFPLGGVMAPNTYGVLARNGDPALNGGVNATIGFWPALVLGNNTGRIELYCNGVLIDDVFYDGVLFGANGASIQLSADAPTNDDPSFWCPSDVPFGLGDLGTPSSPNTFCP